jgi:GDP-L-fucose synthase
MNNSKVFVAGHLGMVGSSVVRKLKSSGYLNIVTKTKSDLDLTNQNQVEKFFSHERFDCVILCAAKVGGILANSKYRADFIYNNIQISSNIIKSSHSHGVKKLINLGSSCIYPKNADIPIKEESLLSGALEFTNEPYAVAKIAALKMCEAFYNQYGSNFYSLMPCNLYGPGDNFDLETSHVVPALIRKIDAAKQSNSDCVEVWGSGKPLRELLYVDDIAEAIFFCLENIDAKSIYSPGISHINCGSEDEVTIRELAETIKKIINYKGNIIFNPSKPDGTFRKKMNNSRITNLGYLKKYSLKEGLQKTHEWYKNNTQSK